MVGPSRYETVNQPDAQALVTELDKLGRSMCANGEPPRPEAVADEFIRRYAESGKPWAPGITRVAVLGACRHLSAEWHPMRRRRVTNTKPPLYPSLWRKR